LHGLPVRHSIAFITMERDLPRTNAVVRMMKDQTWWRTKLRRFGFKKCVEETTMRVRLNRILLCEIDFVESGFVLHVYWSFIIRTTALVWSRPRSVVTNATESRTCNEFYFIRTIKYVSGVSSSCDLRIRVACVCECTKVSACVWCLEDKKNWLWKKEEEDAQEEHRAAAEQL